MIRPAESPHESLEKTDPGNPKAIEGLIKVLKTSQMMNTRTQAAQA
jgi:hypothetical protein